jgi:hypothetical protein
MLRAVLVPAIASHCLYLECSAIKGPGLSHTPLHVAVSGQEVLLHPTMTMDCAPETCDGVFRTSPWPILAA